MSWGEARQALVLNKGYNPESKREAAMGNLFGETKAAFALKEGESLPGISRSLRSAGGMPQVHRLPGNYTYPCVR
jgi:hypothetical protein